MCGISVIIDPANTRVHESDIKRMNNLIRHRGPDGEGYYFGDHFALGHRMLKITDFSEQGRQPMSYMHYVIIHNGEIYNFRGLKESLKQCGYTFQTATDTEVIMAAYDKWGKDCLDQFTGMWSFVLFDTKKKLLFCSRDRFGIKPLFYARVNNRLVLGSEIKQLKAISGFTPSINHTTAFNFLYNARIDGVTETFFKDVYFLPGGHNLIYCLQSHTFKIEQWYDAGKIKPAKQPSFDEAAATFGHLFTASVMSHGQSKLSVGACLSGGLDSTSIAGVAKRLGIQLTTFSSCYTQQGYNEIEYINSAESYYGFSNHKNYPNIHELVEQELLKKIVYHQDQPILSGSFFSEYKVFENAAANKFRIVLSGQGADEYLGGYREFSLLNLMSLLKKGRLPGFAAAIINMAAKHQQSIKTTLAGFIIFGLQLPHFRKKISAQVQAVPGKCLNPHWIHEYGNQVSGSFDIYQYNSLTDLSKDAINRYSLPHQLLSEDRNSMMNSIESRLPFLDHRLIEFCLGLPDRYIIRKGATKAVLRESLKQVLPPAIYNRHVKLGFPCPEEPLFTHNYDFINKEFLDYSNQLPGIFSPMLSAMLRAHRNNKIEYNNIFFRALAFGTWAREFGLLESPAKASKLRATL
ncbi:MAG: asparagine synthase (glutamine-hydrolyzing) [Bacteroidota bacterium]